MTRPDSPDRESHRPTVDDVDPSVLAVNSTPDTVRTHGNMDETEVVQRGDGAVGPVDELADVPEDAEPTDVTPAGEVDPENLSGDVDPDTGDQPTA
ncbi:hypothetical protein KV097_14515 [Mumia sp. zg.B17]|uniref:hypothetical protein n=1 Tax=unclassified Mumia TaxID=2621872 RepID=UPI001C6E5549|nr:MULTISPECIES: hypothetical protein [unclassified Mumia]MBW9207156.1 hypothetical protein [Mumia sp. zg.B17]MDD9347622.1 hypothetical protein [Mumia sp.]